jgi:TusA-related sulfurtransferase
LGDELVAVCTDPGVLHDIPAWCRINGHVVADQFSRDDEHVIVLKVGAQAN